MSFLQSVTLILRTDIQPSMMKFRATFGSEVLLETKSISYGKHKNDTDTCPKHIMLIKLKES